MSSNGFLKGVEHAIASFVLFAAPIVLAGSAGWQDITIGAILTGLYSWARAYSAK